MMEEEEEEGEGNQAWAIGLRQGDTTRKKHKPNLGRLGLRDVPSDRSLPVLNHL